jgi:hypothetical protein
MQPQVVMNEIKPTFPHGIQDIWDACGTHVTSMEYKQGAREIEHFVEVLMESILLAYDSETCWDINTFREHLIKKGFMYD